MIRFFILPLIAIGCGKGGPEYTISGAEEEEVGGGEDNGIGSTKPRE